MGLTRDEIQRVAHRLRNQVFTTRAQREQCDTNGEIDFEKLEPLVKVLLDDQQAIACSKTAFPSAKGSHFVCLTCDDRHFRTLPSVLAHDRSSQHRDSLRGRVTAELLNKKWKITDCEYDWRYFLPRFHFLLY
jgi:hypothetical protein